MSSVTKKGFNEETLAFWSQKRKKLEKRLHRLDTTMVQILRQDMVSMDRDGSKKARVRWTDEEWRARVDRGNMEMECGVCNERSTMHALVPCGHLVCQSCSAKPEVTKTCPFCKQPSIATQVLFKP